MKRFALLLLPLVLLGISCSKTLDGGVYRSLDSGETWQQATFVSSDGKRIQTISDVDVITMVFHPVDSNIIYLGTGANGLYITLTGGETWIQSQIDSGFISSIAVDPTDPSNVYVAQNSNILKSTDEGVTWTAVYSDVRGSSITSVVVDSFEHSRIYASTAAGDIFKSNDYGVNWDIRLQAGVPIKRLFLAEHDTQIIYAFTSDNTIYKSTRGGEPVPGESADTVNSGWGVLLGEAYRKEFPKGDSVFEMALDPNDSSVLYLATTRGLMRGTNDGKDWSDIVTLLGANNPQNELIRNIWVAPGKPNELYFTINNNIHKSVDGGMTWKVIENFPSSRKILRLLIDPKTPNVMYVGMFKVEQEGGLVKKK